MPGLFLLSFRYLPTGLFRQQVILAFVTIQGNDAVNDWLYTMLPVASVVYLVLLDSSYSQFYPELPVCSGYPELWIKQSQCEMENVCTKSSCANGYWQNGTGLDVRICYFTGYDWLYQTNDIYLPVAAINHLSPHQIEAVLLHELSHIKRFDYLINLITRIIQTILYFNPFVRAFASIIEREREKNCDEIVLQFQYEPHGYASALLALEKVSHTCLTRWL